MHRTTWLLAVLVLFFGVSESFAACNSDVTWLRDVSTLKLSNGVPNANENLFDYGVIFEDANDPACAQSAAIALYKKVKDTLNFPVYFDGNVNLNVGPYQGWLEGTNSGLVKAAALRLGALGHLTKPLAALIDQVPSPQNVDAYCGFASNRAGETGIWTRQNSCMEDWAFIAHGRGWSAAWRWNRYGSAAPFLAGTRAAIGSALNTTESVCLHNTGPIPPGPAPAAGPCTATVAEVAAGNAVAMGLHNGDAMPYGIGVMTGVASATVALDSFFASVGYTTDQKTIAKSLLTNADQHTYLDGNPAYAYTWKNDCFGFALSGTSLVRNTNFECWEPAYGNGRDTGYHPEMFPVRDFYSKYLSGAPGYTNFAYNYFDEDLFCDDPIDDPSDPTDDHCLFFGPGRRAVYRTLARDWVYSRPALSSQTWDYTTTFKTYDNVHYLSARNGGYSDVNAEPTTIGTNEQFSMVDVNGGNLMSGDYVWLQVPQGVYVSAMNGGGSTVEAHFNTPITWERFTIQKMNGTGQIFSGDTVALKVYNGQYVSAVNGGGSNVVAQYTAPITWEVFTINFTR